MKNINRIILLFVVLGSLSSCMKNEICNPLTIHLQAGVYTFSESDGIIDTISSKINLDSIYGLSTENNSWMLNIVDAEQISFPLNDATNECSFVLGQGLSKDTIQFMYEKHLLFNSVKCGVSYTYTITNINYSTNLIQEIILTKSEINVISTENIKLVF